MGLAGTVAGTVCDVVGVITGVLQVSVYTAGLDAVVTGLVTTRTASREPEAPGGLIVSGFTAWVPAR